MDRRSQEKLITLDVYTDGSMKSTGPLRFGGWAFIVVQDGKMLYYQAGSEPGTTNQRMELTAIREALNYVHTIRRPSEKVMIYSDSAYAINCYQQDWYIKWQQNGWINSQGKDVANVDLWQTIIPYFDDFWYCFRKVPAHVGHYWNEKCDNLAQEEADRLKLTWRGTHGSK